MGYTQANQAAIAQLLTGVHLPTTATVETPRRDPFEAKCDAIRELQRLVKLIEQDRVTSASIAWRAEGEAVSIEYGNQEDGA